MNQYIYDVECYPNFFLFGGKFRNVNEYYQFEISDRVNHLNYLISHLAYLRNLQSEMIGFNNIDYDYFFVHEILNNPYTFTFEKAFQMSQGIITAQNRGMRTQGIYHRDRLIPQIDLKRVHHFDNKAKMTSLKALQFAMRSDSVEDLPIREMRDLNDEEKNFLISYNRHDLDETEKFAGKSDAAIEMRREYLTDGILTGDVLNYSDVKIGVEYLIARIGRNKCYLPGNRPRQTYRTIIDFSKIILNKIQFRTEMFQNVHSWFMQQKIHLTAKEEARPSLEADLCGLKFHFGVGGVHASAENKIFYSDKDYQIIDIDVAGMYVAVAIANNFAPEHLGTAFTTAYAQIKEDRKKYPKGSSRNAALKLAGNGAYGNSNSPFSPLYDPQYTFSITINGQLQILQLVEFISLLPHTELIQANTDGITIRIRRDIIDWFKIWCKEWESMTGLELEEVHYSRMWIRDVNNYIAEKEPEYTKKGEDPLKRKGAYWYPVTDKDYEGWWNKDFSNFASIKVAELAMVKNYPVETAVRLITNSFDFMHRYKTTGDSVVYIGKQAQLKTVRYYVSTKGEPMVKVSQPKGKIGAYKRKNGLKDSEYEAIAKEVGDQWDERIHTKNKSKYEIVSTSIQSGYLVKHCNKAKDFDWNDVDWNYYIEEAKKLLVGSK